MFEIDDGRFASEEAVMMIRMCDCIHYVWRNEHVCKVTNDKISENICKNCELFKNKNKSGWTNEDRGLRLKLLILKKILNGTMNKSCGIEKRCMKVRS